MKKALKNKLKSFKLTTLGFTLVELLVVIIILGVIALITFPIINKSIKSSKEKALDQVINNIEDAAYKYSISNDIGYQPFYNKIELSTLISAGILKDNIINPVTDEQMQGCVLYKWVEEYKQYEFKYDEECDIAIKTIYDTVIEQFPYLKTNGNGCVTSTSNNYSYMGGCYIKDSGQSGKDIFYSMMNQADMDNETITQTFFDSAGNFIAENFENWAFTDGGLTEEILQQSGKDTAFEILFNMTADELFAQKGLTNFLWYSGFLWRIMGINADGTVRIITDENVTAIPWGEKDTAENWDDSYAKDWLNNYFYNRLKGKDIISKQIWCSEIATNNSSSRMECTNNLSSEIAKVGLITLDEYNLAGKTKSYFSDSQWQWTMTPSDSSSVWSIYSSGNLAAFNLSNYSVGLKPIINIVADAIITGGNGSIEQTWSNEAGPYILNEDKNTEVTGKLNEKATSGEYVMFAGKKYRVVDKDSNGNTKLILYDYYRENNLVFNMKYNDNNSNIFNVDSGIGKKLNTDVLEWLVKNSDTENRNKLVSNYTWYQNNFGMGYNYKISLEEKNALRSINATVGLIRIGEILSSQNGNPNMYWTMTPYIKDVPWVIGEFGYSTVSSSNIEASIRPVIVIKSNVDIISGTGTVSNPYKI